MSKNYTHIKKLMFSDPTVLHALLQKLADAVVTYIKYQADAGAQVVQIFDSWAAQLSPQDFDIFSGPYLSYIIKQAKQVRFIGLYAMYNVYLSNYNVNQARYIYYVLATIQVCPDLPIILYISNSGALVERMAACNPEIISLCHTVDMTEGIERAGRHFAYQGNMDAGVLFGSKDAIERRVLETVDAARAASVRHIMNLGHGVQQGTPEENVAHFFEVAKSVRF